MVSGLTGDQSVVCRGPLRGNSLGELVETYMGELVGDDTYLRYGDEFPLLVKFIDTVECTSVQVHPDDELAAGRHNAYGKDEMWYVLSAAPDAELMIGLAGGTLEGGLNRVKVSAGDAFFVPAGTVHSIGGGVSLVEIQQTSDVTYRIFDWGRTEKDGSERELHIDLAGAAVDFAAPVRRVTQRAARGESALLVQGGHFTVNLLNVSGEMERSLTSRDGFTIYVCTEGRVEVFVPGSHGGPSARSGGGVVLETRGTVLVPADLNGVVLRGEGVLLETYI